MARNKDWNLITQESSDNFTFAFEYDASNNPIYIGKADEGTAKSAQHWQIRKLTFDASNNCTDIQFPNGDDDFQYIWDNRSSYSYS